MVPDAMTVAKALGGGLPIGALITGERLADVLAPGDHGSTFAGGPVIAAAAHAALDVLDDPALLARVRELGTRLQESLRELPGVLDVRGRGLMVAADIDRSAPDVVRRALLEQRLVINATGPQTLRFLPPLVVERGRRRRRARPPRAAAVMTQPEPSLPITARAAEAELPMRVLLVEDDDGDAMLVEEELKLTGARVELVRCRTLAEAAGVGPAGYRLRAAGPQPARRAGARRPARAARARTGARGARAHRPRRRAPRRRGGRGRRAGLPGQGLDQRRAAACARCATRSSAGGPS